MEGLFENDNDYLTENDNENNNENDNENNNVNNSNQFKKKKTNWHWIQVIFIIIGKIVLGIIAGYLSWNCNQSLNILLRILITMTSITFSEIYIFYYAIYRLYLKNDCNSIIKNSVRYVENTGRRAINYANSFGPPRR